MRAIDYAPEVSAQTRDAFEEHSACGCKDLGHALAIAAYKVVELEVGFDRLSAFWNGTKDIHLRVVGTAFWRVTWSAKEQGFITLREGPNAR